VAPLAERISAADGNTMPSPVPGPPALHSSASGSRGCRMPLDRRLNSRERASLILEILTFYVRARKALRETSIEPVVATLRRRALADTLNGKHAEPATETPIRDNSPDEEEPDPQTLTEAHRLGRAVRLTLTLLPGDKRCLARSLVLTQLLAKRRISAKLVIGVHPAPSFLAHAWVEYAGQPVLPVGDGSFGRLVEL
jgi:Transglutaminase-like superfamily